MSDDASDAAVKTTEEAAGVVEAAGAASEATAASDSTPWLASACHLGEKSTAPCNADRSEDNAHKNLQCRPGCSYYGLLGESVTKQF